MHSARVLFAITRGETGGAQEHVRLLASGMQRRGVDVGIAVETPSPLAESLEQAGVRIHPWQSIERQVNAIADVRARRELARIVADFEPTVLHLHSTKAGVLGRGLLARPRGVVVFTCHHAPYGPGRRWSHRVVGRAVDQVTLHHIDGLISVGARDMPILRKLAPRVPLRLVRNATPFAGPPRSPEVPAPRGLWVARMRHPKDPAQAISAWERVIEAVPDAELDMCGTGPLLAAAQQRASRGPAASRIRVLGHVADLEPLQSAASLFVLTSDAEGGTTMATLEAMAQGLIPVMSDVGDAWLLEHARAGIVVPRRSPKALAEATIALLEDPLRLAAMRSAAINFAREQWTVDDMIDATLTFYDEMLRHGACAEP